MKGSHSATAAKPWRRSRPPRRASWVIFRAGLQPHFLISWQHPLQEFSQKIRYITEANVCKVTSRQGTRKARCFLPPGPAPREPPASQQALQPSSVNPAALLLRCCRLLGRLLIEPADFIDHTLSPLHVLLWNRGQQPALVVNKGRQSAVENRVQTGSSSTGIHIPGKGAARWAPAEAAAPPPSATAAASESSSSQSLLFQRQLDCLQPPPPQQPWGWQHCSKECPVRQMAAVQEQPSPHLSSASTVASSLARASSGSPSSPRCACTQPSKAGKRTGQHAQWSNRCWGRSAAVIMCSSGTEQTGQTDGWIGRTPSPSP